MKKIFTILSFYFLVDTANAQSWSTEVVSGVTLPSYFTKPNSVAKDNSGNTWLATDSGLFVKSGGVWSLTNAPIYLWMSDTKPVVVVDNQDRVWWMGGDTLFQYSSGIWQPYNPLHYRHYVALEKDESNNAYAMFSDSVGLHDTLIDLQSNMLSISTSFYEEYGLKIRNGIAYDIEPSGGMRAFDLGPDTLLKYMDYFDYYGGWSLPNFDVTDSFQVVAYSSGDFQFNTGSFISVYSMDTFPDSYVIPVDSAIAEFNPKVRFFNNKIYMLNKYDYSLQCFKMTVYDLQTQAIEIIPIQLPIGYNLIDPEFDIVEGEIYVNGETSTGETFFAVLNSNGVNKIKGSVYLDYNNNGIWDTGETGMPNQLIHLNTGSLSATNMYGNYAFYPSDTSGTYQVSYNENYLNWQVSTPSTINLTQTNSGEVSDSIYFGLAPIGNVNDATVTVVSNAARPNRTTTFTIYITNNGTQPMSGTVDLTLDNLYNYLGSTTAPQSNSGNTYTFAYSNIPAFGSFGFQMSAHLSSSAVMGNYVHTTATAFVSADVNPADNTITCDKLITMSFDPNEKTVSPTGFGSNNVTPPGTFLTYTIQFQNTGSDTAFTIFVADTLDAENLDLTTLNVVASSNPYQLLIKDTGNVKFLFENILLPDSNVNETASHGFIQYQIKVKDSAPDGNAVNNTAFIYFDFNAPVVTNTTTNIIGEPDFVNEINESNFALYPNPATDELTIKVFSGATPDKIEILNTIGVTVLKLHQTNPNQQVNIKSLAAGVYFVKVQMQSGEVVVKKFIKE